MLRENIVSFALGIATAVVLAGCATQGPPPPVVSAAMIDLGGGATEAQLQRGRAIYAGKCTECHGTTRVAKYSTIRWHGIVDEMAPQSKLTASEKSALLDYLSAATAAAHVRE